MEFWGSKWKHLADGRTWGSGGWESDLGVSKVTEPAEEVKSTREK